MVSNKTLAVLVLTAVVLSLGGTILSLNKLSQLQTLSGGAPGVQPTGLVTTGKVNLSITSAAACTVVTNVSLGGSTAPTVTASISTDADNNFASMTFNDCSDAAGANDCKGLTLNNTGNTNLTVNYNSSANATAFLVSQTGLDPTDFKYTFRNGTYSASNQGCLALGNLSGNVTSQNWTNICNRLANNGWLSGATAITMEFNVSLEPDVSQGEKVALITFDCTDTGN